MDYLFQLLNYVDYRISSNDPGKKYFLEIKEFALSLLDRAVLDLEQQIKLTKEG